MKKLLLLLCLLSPIVHADEWMEINNEAGGKILFLPAKCTGTETGRMVIANAKDGTTIHGCWYYFAEMVHVVWTGQGGKTSSFDPKNLTYKKNDD
jgi:hypothetical protein